MKPIAVGDRVRVNWPNGYHHGLEGTVRDGTNDGFQWWRIQLDKRPYSDMFNPEHLINLTPDTSELQPGFYWVRMGGEWTVGRYYAGRFSSWDIAGYIDGSRPDEIGERIERKETP